MYAVYAPLAEAVPPAGRAVVGGGVEVVAAGGAELVVTGGDGAVLVVVVVVVAGGAVVVAGGSEVVVVVVTGAVELVPAVVGAAIRAAVWVEAHRRVVCPLIIVDVNVWVEYAVEVEPVAP